MPSTRQIINSRILQKHDIQNNWDLLTDFIPLNAEIIIYDPDDKHAYPRMKCGDGVTLLQNLPFIIDVEDVYARIENITPLPDIETSDDVVLLVSQLNHQVNDLSSTVTELNSTVNALLDAVILLTPAVGEIYITFSPENPGARFGGTWEQIKDTFLLASGDIYVAGSVGGEATHTLTLNEMPSHTHTYKRHAFNNNESDPETGESVYGVSNKTIDSYLGSTSEAGGGLAHNNMPPYTAVYVWKRIA